MANDKAPKARASERQRSRSVDRDSERENAPTPDVGELREPKRWEVRAALRALARSRESPARRNPAQMLIEVGRQIVQEQNDFTVKQVTERAGVALQTFYRHFGSKDELVLAMLEESVAQGVERMVMEASKLTDPIDRLRSLVQAPILIETSEMATHDMHWRSREQARLATRFPREVDEAHEPYRRAVADAIEAAQAAGLVNSDDPALDADLIQRFEGTITRAVRFGQTSYSQEDAAERVWQICWSGIAR